MNNLYDELLWRGMVKDVSNEAQAKKLLNLEKTKFYCGFDPTGLSLTVGHMVQIIRMKLLQSYGHTPICLIGGATGLIGDPRQTSERKLLSLEESLQNAEKIKQQISKYLNPEDTIFVNNYDWIKSIDMISFLRDYGKYFNINYMLAKDTIQKRLEIGISYTEFSYMILQSIDFNYLYETQDCKLQFGGSDQWGNITSGLELIRKIQGEKHEAVGMSSPLLLKSDGSKFGKSESGALWLDETLTSPYEVYQYFLNASDDDVINYLKMLTLLSREEIQALELSMTQTPELRQSQKKLAEEVVMFLHGETAQKEAKDVSEALFSGEFSNLSLSGYKILEKTLNTFEISHKTHLIDAIIISGLASSKREARAFLASGAIHANGVKIENEEQSIYEIEAFFNQFIIIRRGKKKYAMLVIKED